jgi:hypothetical protein
MFNKVTTPGTAGTQIDGISSYYSLDSVNDAVAEIAASGVAANKHLQV